MRVSQVVELIQGELNNKPAIDSFSSIALSLSSLRRGGLFFAHHPDEIEQAVNFGAYGIIYDQYAQMSDMEIAWIKVSNMQEAIARLVRYFILQKKIEVFCLKPVEFEIFSQICNDSQVIVFDGDMNSLLEKVSQDYHHKGIIIKHDNFLNASVKFNYTVVPQEKPLQIHIASLFDMRVYYKLSQYYLPIPAMLFDNLCSVVYLCLNEQISFDLHHFVGLESVKPIFVDMTSRILEYGQSERVIIAQNEIRDFRDYVVYIAQNGRWGKLLLFVPKGCDYEFDEEVEYYESKEELLDFFKQKKFNFGLVLGMENKALIALLDLASRSISEPSLF